MFIHILYVQVYGKCAIGFIIHPTYRDKNSLRQCLVISLSYCGIAACALLYEGMCVTKRMMTS